MVVARTFTFRRFFLAASMPFLIAAGTSFALPVPKPTIFAPGSPTTTRAEKLRFFPPLTTLVTRLIETTCSFRFRLVESMRFCMPILEFQSRFAGRFGQRLDAAVILIPAAVEHHGLDALVLGALGDELADFLGPGHIAAVLAVLLGRPGRYHRVTLGVVDHLRVDMLHAAKNSQPRTFRRARHAAANALVNAQPDDVFRIPSCHGLLTSRAGLADLLAQRFAGIPDASILVRIGLTQRAHIGRHLSQ